MKTLVAAALLALAGAAPSHAQLAFPAVATAPLIEDSLVLAQADCRAAANRVARATGGRVLAARPDGRGNCVVTVLVPQQGGRPRREERVVPA